MPHKDKAEHNEYQRWYMYMHYTYHVSTAHPHNYSPEALVNIAEAKRKWKRTHHAERNAHRKASLAIPLEDKACECCDATETLVRHHPDYTYPLIVVILCTSCHKYVHGRYPEGVIQ